MKKLLFMFSITILHKLVVLLAIFRISFHHIKFCNRTVLRQIIAHTIHVIRPIAFRKHGQYSDSSFVVSPNFRRKQQLIRFR